MPQQFKNPANPAIHERTTGPEIWNDTDGEIDVLVSGVGTGGTITGVSRYIKNVRSKPISRSRSSRPNEPGDLADARRRAAQARRRTRSRASAPASSRTTSTCRSSTASRQSPTTRRSRPRAGSRAEEGILSGISCGAAVAVALRLARQPEFAGKTIVTILPDSGERYLSSVLFASPA